MVKAAEVVSPLVVRQRFCEYQRFGLLDWDLRGWALDVLRIARQLGESFTLREIYEHEPALVRLHPANRNIRAKIRQQLQVLRDLGFLEFLGKGEYQFLAPFKANQEDGGTRREFLGGSGQETGP